MQCEPGCQPSVQVLEMHGCILDCNITFCFRCPATTSGPQCEYSDKPVTGFVAVQNGKLQLNRISSFMGSFLFRSGC